MARNVRLWRENWIDDNMRRSLEARREKGTLRRLPNEFVNRDSLRSGVFIDFSSNDYLGLAQDEEQRDLCNKKARRLEEDRSASSPPVLGATGSRLLSGDSVDFHELEEYLATVHNRPAAVLCNSGYDANLSLVSSLACSAIVYDAYAHNSLHMGMRLWKSQNGDDKCMASFKHNSVDDLRSQLRRLCPANRVVVLIESVYSMDGDVAPMGAMLDACLEFDVQLVVDEAHGLGVYGRPRGQGSGLAVGTGVLARDGLEQHPALLCSVHTFGKAAGCHGAVICGSQTLKEYLVNYGYPFIYSTALPTHSLATIRCAYETMTGPKGDALRKTVFQLVSYFRTSLDPILRTTNGVVYLLSSTSPIQALMVPGNEQCSNFCQRLYAKSGNRLRLFPIKSPTIPAGQERVRIILHAHNTRQEVDTLVHLIRATLSEMHLLEPRSRL